MVTSRNAIKSLILAMALAVASPQYSTAQARWNSAYQSYIDRYKDLAIEQMLRYNIPASITLAQGLLESGAGRSELTRTGNNHFGIKCHGWKGRKTYHNDDEANECFRAYDSAKDSYEDHSRFLSTQTRYSQLFRLPRTDYKAWARGLKSCGYATNPRYADLLIQIIEVYSLSQYDKASKYDKFLAGHAYSDVPGNDGCLHEIKYYNKNYYIIAKAGDTFSSLSKETGISARKLARYNERDRRDALAQGDVVYLCKKRKKAEKAYRKVLHVVKGGESMYTIAQKYGIRLKSLYKKNNLSLDYQIAVGDRLKVY